MRTTNSLVTIAGATTGDLSTNFNSDPIRTEHITWVAVVATVTSASSLSTSMKLQGCVDIGVDTNAGMPGITGLVNWVDIPSGIGGGAVSISANGSFLIGNLTDLGFNWIRVVNTKSSGAGTVSIRVNEKGVN